MPFETLSERLQASLRRLVGKNTLTEKDIDEMMKDVRLSLLEADVNYQVVKTFTKDVKEKALGAEILKGTKPGDMVVKIVHDELVTLMGTTDSPLHYREKGTTVWMMVGLNGAGKTTQAGKLALLSKSAGKSPFLIAADVYRPAAIEQLKQVAARVDTPVYDEGTTSDVIGLVKRGIKRAEHDGHDLVIIDTAGRQEVNEELMQELVAIAKAVTLDETLLVLDAMTGQDAVNVIKTFNERLAITGCILTKMDGDTRGGAALSIRELTEIPIKFLGTGEKMEDLESFHPDRMADRILGMGDVVSFVEKVQKNVDEKDAERLAAKMAKGTFDYNDFASQIQKIKKMGSLKGLLGLIPGVGSALKDVEIDEKKFVYLQAIVSSMTAEERSHPDLVERSSRRRDRIARGAGRPMNEVNQLVKQFNMMKEQMRAMGKIADEDVPTEAPSEEETREAAASIEARLARREQDPSRGYKGKGKHKGRRFR